MQFKSDSFEMYYGIDYEDWLKKNNKNKCDWFWTNQKFGHFKQRPIHKFNPRKWNVCVVGPKMYQIVFELKLKKIAIKLIK